MKEFGYIGCQMDESEQTQTQTLNEWKRKQKP